MLPDTIHPANRRVMERRSCMVISPSAEFTNQLLILIVVNYMDIHITSGAYDGMLIK